MLQVAHTRVDPAPVVDFPAFFAYIFNSAELDPRPSPRFLLCQAFGDMLSSLPLNVLGQFLREVMLRGVAKEERLEALPETAPAHVMPFRARAQLRLKGVPTHPFLSQAACAPRQLTDRNARGVPIPK